MNKNSIIIDWLNITKDNGIIGVTSLLPNVQTAKISNAYISLSANMLNYYFNVPDNYYDIELLKKQ